MDQVEKDHKQPPQQVGEELPPVQQPSTMSVSFTCPAVCAQYDVISRSATQAVERSACLKLQTVRVDFNQTQLASAAEYTLKVECGLSLKNRSTSHELVEKSRATVLEMPGVKATINTGGTVPKTSLNYPAQHTQLSVSAAKAFEVHVSPTAIESIGRIGIAIGDDISAAFSLAVDVGPMDDIQADEAVSSAKTDATVSPNMWACASCTFLNQEGSTVCGVCGLLCSQVKAAIVPDLHRKGGQNETLAALIASGFITDVTVVPHKSCVPAGYTVLDYDINHGQNHAINHVFICFKRGDTNAVQSGTVKRPIADMMIIRHEPTEPNVGGGMCLRSAAVKQTGAGVGTAGFIGLDATGQLKWKHTPPGCQDYFAVKPNGDGTIALNGPNDRWVTANDNGTIECQERHVHEVSQSCFIFLCTSCELTSSIFPALRLWLLLAYCSASVLSSSQLKMARCPSEASTTDITFVCIRLVLWLATSAPTTKFPRTSGRTRCGERGPPTSRCRPPDGLCSQSILRQAGTKEQTIYRRRNSTCAIVGSARSGLSNCARSRRRGGRHAHHMHQLLL
jgi:hypothetical protein